MIFIPKAASGMCALASKDAARYALNHLRVREVAGERFHLEATDGKRLAILRGPCLPTPQEVLAAGAHASPETILTEGLLLASVLKGAFKMEGDNLGILLGRPNTLLFVINKSLITEPGEGRFPDVDAVLPKTPALFSIAVDPILLASILTAASKVQHPDACKVQLLFWNATSPMGIICQGPDGITFDAMLMPLA